MEELIRLSHIVTLFSKKQLPIIDIADLKEVKGTTGKEKQLLTNILNNKYKSDEDAILDIYGNKKNSYRYRMLKSRLRQKLYNNLFFIENNIRVARKEEKFCLNLAYQGKALIQVADYKLAEKLFKKSLQVSEKFEFTDITIDCYQYLNLICTQLPDYKGFYKTLDKLKHYRDIKKDENEAYELYFTSKLELNKSVASKKRYIKLMPPIIARLRELWRHTNSFNIFQHYYYLKVWHLELVGDFHQGIQEIEKCEKLLKEGKINVLRFDRRANAFAYTYGLLRAKRYKKGLAIAKQYLQDFNPFSRNWFAYMEFYYLLAMHIGNHALAVDLIRMVDENQYFKRLNKKAVERWALFKAYLYFVNPQTSILQKFNYQKFITAVPEYSKDKLGYNVAIHILQFLYHLKNQDYDQLYYKEGALRKYLNTYLKDTNNQRSRYFFRLLIIIIRVEFDPKKSNQKASAWLRKLSEVPMPGDAYAEIEIIPYEKLWELILKLMKK